MPDAQGGRAMTIDDLIGAVRVADPQLSPDGRMVAYVRTTTDVKSGRRNADLWVVPAEGGAAKELVGGDKSENTPRWSPSGKAAGVHLHSRRRSSGVSSRMPTAAASARSPSSPRACSRRSSSPPTARGSRSCPTSIPECADEACNKRRKEEVEKNPVKVRRLTRLLSRHWDEWREDVRHHVMVADLQSKRVVDVTPGDFDSPPGQAEDNAIAFSPDGKEIAFVSNREGNDREAWTTNNDVFLVPVTGGSAKKLTPGTRRRQSAGLFSRRFRRSFVRAQRRGGFESDRWYLDAYDRARGSKRDRVRIAGPVGRRLRALARRQRDLVRRRRTGAREPLHGPGEPAAPPNASPKGVPSAPRAPAAASSSIRRSSMTMPPEVFRVSSTGGAEKALTMENEAAEAGCRVHRGGEPDGEGRGGTAVQYWLIRPPNFDASRKYPVVFLIHGGPQGAWEDAWSTRWNPSLWAAQGWVIAAPNPRGSTGFGQKFVDEISSDWGGKVMADINAVIDRRSPGCRSPIRRAWASPAPATAATR